MPEALCSVAGMVPREGEPDMIDDLDADEDLFAVRPVAKPLNNLPATHNPPESFTPPAVPEVSNQTPALLVASFACACGARDEVREPAPASVPCWQGKCGRAMSRWTPDYVVPIGNARIVAI